MASSFQGPFFLVGFARSGTKLLRDLLNRNPRLGIPLAETNFIPRFVSRYGNPPPFQNDDVFRSFYSDYSKTSFFWWMKRFGRVMSFDELDCRVERTSWPSIFEAIVRWHVPPSRDPDFIWGDKSPAYLSGLPLLKELFPSAKVIHIIRDPRDCCLSARRAWGTPLSLTAEQWRRTVVRAREAGQRLRDSYLEVSYEALLEDPEATIRTVCSFLGCDFLPDMLEPERISENLGRATGALHIVRGNRGKYRTELRRAETRRIEEIAYPVLIQTGYAPRLAADFKPLAGPSMTVLAAAGRFRRLLFDVRDKGAFEGLRFFFRESR